MSNFKQDEKIEEKEEKEPNKHEEKTTDEKWRRDPLSGIVWAAILIWAGLCFLAENLGWLQNISFPYAYAWRGAFISMEAWTLILLGAAVIIIVEVIIRLTVPAFRRPVRGSIFIAAVLLASGLGTIFGYNIVWPVILIALGLLILLRTNRWRH